MRRLEKVREFFLHEFPSGPQYMDAIEDKMLHPLKVDYALAIMVAETPSGDVRGFGVYDHFPELGLSYLEYLVAGPTMRSQGIGGGIYEAMRERLTYDGSEGLLFEVNADDEDLPEDVRRANGATLKFYERYDARPLEGIRFDYPPFREEKPRLLVVYDDLGARKPLSGERLRKLFRRLYASKYHARPDDPVAQRIVASVPTGPLKRRPLRYIKRTAVDPKPHLGAHIPAVEAFVSTAHRKHVVPERDYLERPLRAERLLAALRDIRVVAIRDARAFPDKHLLDVHDKGMVDYLKRASERLAKGQTIYPTVFPVRRRIAAPRGAPTHAGYYSLDSFTPLTRNAYAAARAAVDVALTGAARLREGTPEGPVYALTRPPGHHAERDLFGGFCYFNNGAVAAQYLAQDGRVAVLDVDHHHGNGAQQIFWERDDVLTVSVHGDPRASYPYFTGFEDERGGGAGEGHNHNFTLPEGAGDDEYVRTLRKALKVVRAFQPQALVVPLGLDISKDDPSGTFRVSRKGFRRIAGEIAALKLPTLLVQEGGYNLRHLGGNLTAFLEGWSEPL